MTVIAAKKMTEFSLKPFATTLLNGGSLRSALEKQFATASNSGVTKAYKLAPESLRQKVFSKLEEAGIPVKDDFKRAVSAYYHESDVSLHSPSYRKVWEPLASDWFNQMSKSNRALSVKIVKLPNAKQLAEDLKPDANMILTTLKRFFYKLAKKKKDVKVWINKPWKWRAVNTTMAEVRIAPDMVAFVSESKVRPGMKEKLKTLIDTIEAVAKVIGKNNKKLAGKFNSALKQLADSPA